MFAVRELETLGKAYFSFGVHCSSKTDDGKSELRLEFTVALKSNANAMSMVQRHEQQRSQPAQLSL